MNIVTHVFENEQALWGASAERVVQLAAEAMSARQHFFLALAGGKTPEGLYGTLAKHEFASRIDWDRTHIYFGDERCVPPDHCDSNYRMAHERLLDHVPIPQEQIHRIAGEKCATDAAEEYARTIIETVPAEHRLPRFDLILLGLGLDGHVASLFPGSDILQQRNSAAAVYVNKLEAWRVSLTLPVINNARHVLLLVAGAKKADVVRHVLRGTSSAATLPVQMINPDGELEWYLDSEAARLLGSEKES